MKELRCLAFTELEVAAAVIERRRKLREVLPEGSIQKVSYEVGENGVSVTIRAVTGGGRESAIVVPENEASAALVNYCMSRGIPMPAVSDKYLHVVNDGLTLIITVRFNKALKGAYVGSEDPMGPAGGPGGRMRGL